MASNFGAKMSTLPQSSVCVLWLGCVSVCCRQWDIMMKVPVAPAPPSPQPGPVGRLETRSEASSGVRVSCRALPGQSHWGGCPAITGTHCSLPVKWHTSAPQLTLTTIYLSSTPGHGHEGPGDLGGDHPDVGHRGPGEHDPVPRLLLPEAQQGAGLPVQGGQHPPPPQAQGVHQCKTGGKNNQYLTIQLKEIPLKSLQTRELLFCVCACYIMYVIFYLLRAWNNGRIFLKSYWMIPGVPPSQACLMFEGLQTQTPDRILLLLLSLLINVELYSSDK